jgi:hypothetical protein
MTPHNFFFRIQEGRQAMRNDGRAMGERGFAMILAILSLMLLTFLGLTLATTTSTELQIATNFRWSQQALYNAEAGLEASKLLLSNVAIADSNWQNIVPAARGGTWVAPFAGQNLGAPAEAPPGAALRDYERNNCNDRAKVGYGVVLRAPDPSTGTATRWENVSTFMTKRINGAFTIWVRREVTADALGQFSDDQLGAPTNLVVTAEGVAPYPGAANAFTRANQATRIIEQTYNLVTGDPCQRQGTQEGAGPTGENFDSCSPLTAGAGGSLQAVFGAGGGTLAQNP